MDAANSPLMPHSSSSTPHCHQFAACMHACMHSCSGQNHHHAAHSTSPCAHPRTHTTCRRCCCCSAVAPLPPSLKPTTQVSARTPAFMGAPVLPPHRPHTALAPARGPRPAAAASGTSRALGVAVEANLFSRLVRVVKAYVSNFTEQWEDPEVLLDRVTDEMNEDLVKMRQATAKVRWLRGVCWLRICMHACTRRRWCCWRVCCTTASGLLLVP